MLPHSLAFLPARHLHVFTKRVSTVPFATAGIFDHEGQWLWNDALQRSICRVNFQAEALQKIAFSAVGAQRCIRFERIAQGPYNKIFLLEFDNGREVIARIPCALVGNVRLSTASEVATMEYVRDVIGHPTPRVLAWSSTPEARSAVGSDFILMERTNGVALEDRWLNTFDHDIGAAIKEMLFLDIDLHQWPFSQIGSLFFKEDVSPELQGRPLYAREKDNEKPDAEKYWIGPVVNKQYWFDKPIEGDRGPCKARYGVFHSSHLPSSAASPSPSPSSLISRSKPSDLPELRQLLQQCILMAPHIIPSDRRLIVPYLTHPDLSRSNVIVKPSGAANVVSYIDWQGAVALPYFQSISLPDAILYEGKLISVPDDPFASPELPSDVPPELKEQAYLEWRPAKRQRIMSNVLFQKIPLRLQAAQLPQGDLLSSIPDVALRCYADGPQFLRRLVYRLYDIWPNIMDNSSSPIECPVQLTEADRAQDREEISG
ncbi:kinase-like domain-containing protein [Armillaria borealis]|uniref:Altered inheritance of mitochondria protein 9, mitochondrial n=1 Tax=Armillaria borealis TaxID=47425 RepID=A0AA39J9J5_9AGAR|nr:kinase-like domain-containing protein [Armillaria borealis]